MNNNKTMTSSRILLIASALTIVLLLVLSVFKISHIKETSSAIDNLNTVLHNNKDRLKNLELLRDYLPELENAYKTLNDKIPVSPDKPKLTDLLNKYANESNVTLIQIGFEEESEDDSLNEIPLNLSYEGEYTSIVKMLEKLDYGERLIRIDEIEIISMGSFSTNIKADISAAAFYSGR